MLGCEADAGFVLGSRHGLLGLRYGRTQQSQLRGTASAVWNLRKADGEHDGLFRASRQRLLLSTHVALVLELELTEHL